MEELTTIEAKKEQKTAVENQDKHDEQEHTEAVALFEKYQDFFEHYAKGKIKIEPAPKGLETFAFNLEKNTIYVNSMFYKKQGLSEEKTVFAILHEIEHFMEKMNILSEDGGVRKFEKYLKNIKASKAFGVMDNCVADIRENRTVLSKNTGMGDLEQEIYKKDLFPSNDFTTTPKHLQFCQAILREARLPEEICIVAPEVRTALDEVTKIPKLLNIMTNPGTPMSLRLRLQEKYIWPKVEALLEQDLKEQKEKNKEGKKGEGEGESKNGENGENNQEDQEGQGNSENDPNKIFAKDYEEMDKKFGEAVPMEDVEKALKEYKEGNSSQGKSKKSLQEKADQDYADKIGVEKQDLQNYRKIAGELERIVNPETDISVREELRSLFYRIVSKRSKPQMAPKYPMTEGDELVDPAKLIADVKAGNLQPRVWEDTEIKDKKGDKFGEVEITLVCDRSSSMNEDGGKKAVEQRKSAVLVMEVLREFAEICEDEKSNTTEPLMISSEIYTFSSTDEDKIPLKNMSPELGEAERVNILKKLYDLPGSTTDYVCLETIANNLDDKTKSKIKEGSLKKIVIIFTDGGSDNSNEVMSQLESLREDGVVAIGVGITESGQQVLTTYAPNARVVTDVSKLPIELGELLKNHLKDL